MMTALVRWLRKPAGRRTIAVFRTIYYLPGIVPAVANIIMGLTAFVFRGIGRRVYYEEAG
jgi:hypothetical protein